MRNFNRTILRRESATALPLFVSSVKVKISRPLARIQERSISFFCRAGCVDKKKEMKREKKTKLDGLAAFTAAWLCIVPITTVERIASGNDVVANAYT